MAIGLFVESLIQTYGLVGLLAASIVANASLFLLLPIDFLVFARAPLSKFHPLILGLVAGFGAAIGEMTGYVVGLGGRKLSERKFSEKLKQVDAVKERLHNKGALFIFFGALTPFPFDLIAIVAGMVRFDIRKFFLLAFAGKFARYSIIAYAGLLSADIVLKFFGAA